ncbi:hypothetical protein C8R44DRAFT_753377 [Mycena epipterygia]|nr:hypothetical protein C8R44DRAFT_753377 [Mycena epipterygia]
MSAYLPVENRLKYFCPLCDSCPTCGADPDHMPVPHHDAVQVPAVRGALHHFKIYPSLSELTISPERILPVAPIALPLTLFVLETYLQVELAVRLRSKNTRSVKYNVRQVTSVDAAVNAAKFRRWEDVVGEEESISGGAQLMIRYIRFTASDPTTTTPPTMSNLPASTAGNLTPLFIQPHQRIRC